MSTYKLAVNGVLRDYGTPDEAFIPSDANNPDWVAYQAWLALGNTPAPADVVTVVNPPRKITKLAFRNRYTTAEKIAMEIASLDDPTAQMSARQAAAALRATLKDLDNSAYIDLERPETAAGVNFLVTLGILTQDRANHVLTDPVQDVERPLLGETYGSPV